MCQPRGERASEGGRRSPAGQRELYVAGAGGGDGGGAGGAVSAGGGGAAAGAAGVDGSAKYPVPTQRGASSVACCVFCQANGSAWGVTTT
jgi:hypothetical protein